MKMKQERNALKGEQTKNETIMNYEQEEKLLCEIKLFAKVVFGKNYRRKNPNRNYELEEKLLCEK